MLNLIRKEPALVTGLVSAAIALGVSFGLSLSSEQTGGILAFVVAVLAFVTRSQVTPTSEVAVTKAEFNGEGGHTVVLGAVALLAMTVMVLVSVYLMTPDLSTQMAILGKASILGKA